MVPSSSKIPLKVLKISFFLLASLVMGFSIRILLFGLMELEYPINAFTRIKNSFITKSSVNDTQFGNKTIQHFVR
jgi:hypothetical protein